MKIFGIILGVIGVIIVALLIYLGYLGAFSTVTVTEKPLDSFWMVYGKHIGEYKDVGPVMDGIYHDLKDNYSITTTKGVGLYYDNPQEVPKEKCRSIAGCILEERDASRIDELKKKYMVREYPASNCVVAEFPFKTKMSIIVGIIKVYPALGNYVEEKGYTMGPSLEIYDKQGKKTVFVMSTDLELSLLESFLERERVVEEEEALADTVVSDSIREK
jgi:DNA gyrase inhibitor GyrI